MRRSITPVAGWLVDAIIDVPWWPTPVILALALLVIDRPSRPEVHPGMVLLTGLVLVPVASRFPARAVQPAGAGWLLPVTAARTLVPSPPDCWPSA